MFFYPTITFELSRLISETPSKFSAGWDGIPSILLKYLPINALSALSYVFNLSLSQGKFITFVKHAKVIPIFKKGNTKMQQTIDQLACYPIFQKFLKKSYTDVFIRFSITPIFCPITSLVLDKGTPPHMLLHY